jgi:hypothetical protein
VRIHLPECDRNRLRSTNSLHQTQLYSFRLLSVHRLVSQPPADHVVHLQCNMAVNWQLITDHCTRVERIRVVLGQRERAGEGRSSSNRGHSLTNADHDNLIG